MGIAAGNDLAGSGRAELARAERQLIQQEVVIAADIGETRVHTPAFAAREQVAEPAGIGAVDGRGAVEVIEHGLVARRGGADGAGGGRVGRVVLEKIPAPRDGEAESGKIEFGAQAVLVPVALYIQEHRVAAPVGIELLRGGKRRAILRVPAVTEVE